uniref:THAP domain-containing protein 1 n=1 Tax=Hippocampus comes TaxID=109280 RepID=A0A3Q3DBL0_HIPCM
MSSHCVAYGCGKTAENDVTLFRFPKDPEEFHKWEKQVQRTRSNWFASPNCHLCSDHFGKDYFESISPFGVPKLKPGAVPTVFVLIFYKLKSQCLFFNITMLPFL